MLAALNPRQWPYWLKLAAILLAFVIVSRTLVINAFESAAEAEAEGRLRDFVYETALTRAARIEGAVGNALDTIGNAASTAYLRPRLLRLLQITGTPSSSDIVARSEATDLLRFRLIENGLFEYVRVVSLDGVIAASVHPLDAQVAESEVVGVDVSRSQAFIGAIDAQTLGEPQRLIVYRTDDGVDQAEVIQMIEIDQEIVGFLIGRLNLQNTLLNNLTSVTDPEAETQFSIISYLATRTGVVLTDPGSLQQATESVRSAPINQALAGQRGFAEYRIAGVALPMVGYYLPISNTALALITEVSTARFDTSVTRAAFGSAPWLIPIVALIGVVMVYIVWRDGTTMLRETRRVISADLDAPLEVNERALRRPDAFGAALREAVAVHQQTKDSMQALNQRLQASIRDIAATQEVGRFATTQRDQQRLMEEVVALIIKVFPNIYHAQIFLNDEQGENAVLRASTGDAGRKLLERGHRLGIGGTSVIGRTTGEGTITAVLDTMASEVHRVNELLPNTRAELAIPLRLGERVIGALDVQSTVANSFTPDQISTLQAMADQIAVSLENARLYQESVAALNEIARTNRDNTAAAWREHLFSVRSRELVAWAGTPTRTDTETLRAQAIKTGVTQIGSITSSRTVPLAVPIALRGQVLGAVLWELPINEFGDDKVQLAEELVGRLAVSLDNARLFEESQRAAERERVLNDIAAKITAQSDVEAILTTAVREVGQALQTRNVSLRLGVEGARRRTRSNEIFKLGGAAYTNGADSDE